jgi:WD40 repeat protein
MDGRSAMTFVLCGTRIRLAVCLFVLSIPFVMAGESTIASTSRLPDVDAVAGQWQSISRCTEPIATLEGHASWVTGVACSPDGRWLFSASHDHTARLWRLADFEPVLVMDDSSRSLWNATFSPDGTMVAAGGDDAVVYLWTVASGKLSATFPPRHDDWFEREIFAGHTLGHSGRIEGGAFSPDGRRLIAGGDGGKAVVWETRSGKGLFELTGHAGSIHGVDFSPDGRWIATGSIDGAVMVLRATDGALLHWIQGLKGGVAFLRFSADSTMLVCALTDGRVMIIDPKAGRPFRQFDGVTGGVMAVAMTPDQRHIVAQAGNDAVLFETASGRAKVILSGHKDTIDALTFTPDGRRVITGGLDSTIKVWDTSKFVTEERP